MNLRDIVPLEMHEPLRLLGRLGSWLRVQTATFNPADSLPRTALMID
jgi:hypothetical protein